MYVALYKLCLREYDEQGHFTIMPQQLTSFFILYIFVLSLSLDLVWLFAAILLDYFTFLFIMTLFASTDLVQNEISLDIEFQLIRLKI